MRLLLVALVVTLSASPALAGETLRIATYNVNFGLAGDPLTLQAIADTEADIIALQETNAEWQRAIEDELSDTFPHRVFHHCCRAGGLALLSRFPVTIDKTVAGLEGWFPAWHATVNAPDGPIRLVVLHLRPPVSNTGNLFTGYFLASAIHTAELEAFVGDLELDAMPTVVLGDLNESPTGAAITALEHRGMTNALPRFDPDAVTWRWNTKLGEIVNTLDHVLVSSHFEVEGAEVLEIGRSDHLPVVVEITKR